MSHSEREDFTMTQQPAIAILGSSGRMGQMLAQTVLASDQAKLVAAADRIGSDWIGQDLGVMSGGTANGIIVSDDMKAVFRQADVVIDFTLPHATVQHAKIAAETGTALVIGTTGMNDGELAAIAQAGQSTAIVRAGNMSLGVNLLTQLTQKVAAALGEEFDIEVVEYHHNQKVDAPSGTALMLGEAAAAGRGVSLHDVKDSGRDGITGARTTGDIGFVAVRGGDIVGEHDVLFAGAGERIVLRHVATDRALFARGAVRAAIWASAQSAGEYSMLDVLGL